MQNMKRLLFALFALLLCLSLLACSQDITGGGDTQGDGVTDGTQDGTADKTPNETPKEESPLTPIHDIEYLYLGTPLAERYTEGERARCALDLILYGNMLYAGSGDYDVNLGPAAIPRYDVDLDTWYTDATVPDEEVNRFFVIDGKLMTPGIDPKEDWELGNYYVLSEDGETWDTVRTIPNGIHTFDMVEYGEGIFVGCGVSAGGHPVRVSFDGGESFAPVEMRKDGTPVDTTAHATVRSYDFFVQDGVLYATLMLTNTSTYYELYRYDSESNVFFYEADLRGTYRFYRNTFIYFDAKANFDGRLYLSTGVLYDASDLTRPESIPLGEGAQVVDLYLANGKLYALTFLPEGEGYRIAVYAKTSADAPFAECFNFHYSVPALSLAVDGVDFYLGMGSARVPNAHNGDVLYVNYWQ